MMLEVLLLWLLPARWDVNGVGITLLLTFIAFVLVLAFYVLLLDKLLFWGLLAENVVVVALVVVGLFSNLFRKFNDLVLFVLLMLLLKDILF